MMNILNMDVCVPGLVIVSDHDACADSCAYILP